MQSHHLQCTLHHHMHAHMRHTYSDAGGAAVSAADGAPRQGARAPSAGDPGAGAAVQAAGRLQARALRSAGRLLHGHLCLRAHHRQVSRRFHLLRFTHTPVFIIPESPNNEQMCVPLCAVLHKLICQSCKRTVRESLSQERLEQPILRTEEHCMTPTRSFYLRVKICLCW